MRAVHWIRTVLSVGTGVVLLGLLCACGDDSGSQSGEASEAVPSSVDDTQTNADAKLSKIERELLALDKLTDAGDVDRAAAGLVRMRMKGAKFNANDAAAYRDSLSLAYDRAIELADEGSAKGKAALKILQSNGAF